MPGKKAGSVHHKYCSSKISKQSMGRSPGLPSLCFSQSLIKWGKRRLENLTLTLYVICVSQSRERYSLHECHKIPGSPLHLLLAPAKMCMHQSRRKKTTPDKMCVCKWRSLFSLLVILHSIVQLTCLVHARRQLCYVLGVFPSTLAAILCSVFVPLFWTDDMPPWSSSDTTFVTLFDGGLNHVILRLAGVKGTHKFSTHMHFKLHSLIRVIYIEEEKNRIIES